VFFPCVAKTRTPQPACCLPPSGKYFEAWQIRFGTLLAIVEGKYKSSLTYWHPQRRGPARR